MSIWRWSDYFTQTPPQHRITLGEGDTPVVRSRRLGLAAGLEHLYFKLESSNPTGSYKDRFGAAAISDMLATGKTLSIGTSSGNTGAAVAGYCAAAGIRCEIAILESAPFGKVKQMMAYGANVYKVRGMGIDPEASDRTAERLRRKAGRTDAKLQISAFKFSPEGMAGVQTIGYELHEQAADPAGAFGGEGRIDHVFVQAGGGGLTWAVARGFAGLVERGRLEVSPAVHCVQPEGNNTIAGPLRDGLDRGQDCTCTSEVSGLQVGSVIDGHDVIPACRSTGGTGHVVTDEAVWSVQKRLAREEGIFCEPAGAVSVVGALEAAQRGQIKRDDRVVCLITGIGFKDPPAVDRMLVGMDCPTIEVEQIDEM